jgi:hypothetical protein
VVLTSVDARRELQRRAAEELAKRRDTPEFKDAVIAALRSELFDLQLRALDAPYRRLALCCSRRAGKSELAARMIAIELLRAKHNDFVLFAARTLQRARNIIWSILEKIDAEYGLGWKMSAHIGQIITPSGGVFILLGVDDANAVEKTRGSRYRLAFLDEAATYEENLERLVIDCLEPGCVDTRGKIVLAGTPGYVRRGFWYEVVSNQKPGWRGESWTLADNPHIPDVQNALKEIREANGWAEEDPTYQREYLGRWSVDESALVYAFDERRNTCTELPSPPDGLSLDEWIRQDWLTTVAADIGYTDAFAVVALGSPPHSQDIFVLYAYAKEGLLAGEQADLIKEARDRYRPQRTVVDVGGQGKLVQQEFNARYGNQAGGPLMAAIKTGKLEAIGLFNSDMRTGKIKAHLPHAAPLCTEWAGLPWATEEKNLEHKGFPNHISCACTYGWRIHKSFLAKPAAPPKTEADLERERVAQRNREAAAALKRRR